MKFQGFIGPTYSLDSVNVDCQRTVNWYPEIIESGTGKEAQQLYFKPTPGLEELFDIGDGPIRLIHFDNSATYRSTGGIRVFVVSGSEVYRLYSFNGGTSWETVMVGELATSEGPVSAASAEIDQGVTVFVDGSDNYLHWIYGPSEAPDQSFGPFSDYAYAGVIGATHVNWIDGYFVFNKKNTGQYYVSDWASFTVDPLSYATAEGDPDKIVSVIVNNRQLILFNERSTEFFVNTGNADFPFERISGGFIEKGCKAPFSVAKIDTYVFWLGRDQFGQGIVYATNGTTPQRISTHAIEQKISTYADIEKATGYTYQKNGHSFYVLNFQEMTWVYDLSTRMWHEWAYTNEGELERHRADMHCFIPSLNEHWVGDYANGKIYKLNDEVFLDGDAQITRMRISPHTSGGKKNLFFSSFELDMEVGVGLDGGVQGSDPQMMLTWSDDGGHTWSNEVWANIGKKIGGIGEYKTRVRFNRLGRSRDRVWKLVMTDPVRSVLMGAELEVVSGVS